MSDSLSTAIESPRVALFGGDAEARAAMRQTLPAPWQAVDDVEVGQLVDGTWGAEVALVLPEDRTGWADLLTLLGRPVVDAAEKLRSWTQPTEADYPLRFAVHEVRDGMLWGRVESGTLRLGDGLVFSPMHKTSVVAEILGGEQAGTSAWTGLRLREKIQVERGQIASLEHEAPIESNRFKARLQWLGEEPLRVGCTLRLRLSAQEVEAEIAALEGVLALAKGEIGEVTFQTRGALVMDNFARNPSLGRFLLLEDEQVAGAGIVFGGHYLDRTQVMSQNIFWSEGNVTARVRARRNGHKGAVLWLTGLSGSGKSTISRALERELFQQGMQVYVLDGDNIRHGLNANLGFSPVDREENIRRVAEVAKLLSDAGVIAVTAFISPYRDDRRRAREIALEAGGEFIEVFVHAPLEVCEQRDVKGLYKKARAGQITQFTGISAPYEEPADPEVTVATAELSLAECVARIVTYLQPRLVPERDSAQA